MDIKWKARFKNYAWWYGTISTTIAIGTYFGIDITKYIGQDWKGLIVLIIGLGGYLGATVDTSTKGLSDAIIATTTVQATNQASETKEEVKLEDATTTINNKVSEKSESSLLDTSSSSSNKENVQAITINASSKITIDNPDNIKALGATVNSISAASPSANN